MDDTHFTDLRDLIAETAADLSNLEPFWTAGSLADALIKKGVLATRTDATPVAWMIERDDISTVQSGGRVCLHYYAEEKYKPGWHYWTPDHAMAKRFTTRDAAINETNGDPILRVAEHKWVELHPPATDVAALVDALEWYRDQMCEGYCEGYDPRACAAFGPDKCAGCPAAVALAPFTKGQNDE